MVNEVRERYFRERCFGERCFECKHAVWDYETYYGTTKKEWFVNDCKKCNYCEDLEGCEEFEPVPYEEDD